MTLRALFFPFFLSLAVRISAQPEVCASSDVALLFLGGFMNKTDGVTPNSNLAELDSVKACNLAQTIIRYFPQAFAKDTKVALSMLATDGSRRDFTSFLDFRRTEKSLTDIVLPTLEDWCRNYADDQKKAFDHESFAEVDSNVDIDTLKFAKDTFTYEQGIRSLNQAAPRLLVLFVTSPVEKFLNFDTVKEFMTSIHGTVVAVSWESYHMTSQSLAQYAETVVIGKELGKENVHMAGEIVKKLHEVANRVHNEVLAFNSPTAVSTAPSNDHVDDDDNWFGGNGPLGRAVSFAILFCIVSVGGFVIFFA